jgi:TolB protein
VVTFLALKLAMGMTAVCAVLIAATSAMAKELPGAVIAYVASRENNKEIYLLDSNRNWTVQLTYRHEDVCCLAWSPDGEKLAYVVTQQHSRAIFVMGWDGRNARQLTPDDVYGTLPSWSPDGQEIIFAAPISLEGTIRTSAYHNRLLQIFVIGVDGSGLRQLFQSDVPEDYPVWSPDGNQIAYVSYRNPTVQIYLMDTNGRNQRRLTHSYRTDYSPAWSPDGSRIAYSSIRAGGKNILYVIDAACSHAPNGCVPQRLTEDDTNNAEPAWSPDGGQIAFLSDRDRVWEIYLMDVDGRNQRRLTHEYSHVYSFAWLP